MSGKHILLGVTGGIAAYKSADLVRRLRETGAEVRVVMTHGALAFGCSVEAAHLSIERRMTSEEVGVVVDVLSSHESPVRT